MKILFLDHDGVICLSSEWGGRFNNEEGLDSIFDQFNKEAIEVLNEIIKKTDCEIVITSDWKNYAKLDQMKELYKIRGVLKSPIDYTPDPEYKEDFKWSRQYQYEQLRCLEVKTWLKRHPEVIKWVAVDDMNLSSNYFFDYDGHRKYWGLDNFVCTPISNEGIKQKGVKEKIINILNIS